MQLTNALVLLSVAVCASAQERCATCAQSVGGYNLSLKCGNNALDYTHCVYGGWHVVCEYHTSGVLYAQRSSEGCPNDVGSGLNCGGPCSG